MTYICVFGDSIGYGAWDTEGGWVQRLRNWLDERAPQEHIIYNCGVSGDSSSDLLKRFKAECKARFKEADEYREEKIIVIAVGGNDSIWMLDKKKLKVQPNQVESNIKKIIGVAKKFTNKIVIVGVAPADEKRTTPFAWNSKMFFKNENIVNTNKIIKTACNRKGIPFVDIYADWVNSDYKSLLSDGTHPNSEGHKRIFELVRNELSKLL